MKTSDRVASLKTDIEKAMDIAREIGHLKCKLDVSRILDDIPMATNGMETRILILNKLNEINYHS
jgi:hypothetical protein